MTSIHNSFSSRAFKIFRKTNLLFAGFLLLNSQITNAEEILLSEEDYFSNTPLVTDASRLPTSVNESPVSVSVITREMIEASGAINIADLFRFVPGYQVGHANGGRFAVNPHDLTDRFVKRIEVRLNSISVYETFSSTTLWEELGIQVEDIDHIEITRGSNSVSHGFNSFMGSINIITINPQKEHKTRAQIRVGNVDYQSYQLRHSDSLKNIHYRFGLDHKTHDGFTGRDDDVDVSNLNFNAFYSPNFNNEIEVGLFFANSDVGRGDIEAPGDPEFFSDTKQNSTREYLKWKHLFNNNNELYFNFNHHYFDSENTPIFIFGEVPLSTALGITPAMVNALFGAPDQIIPFAGKGETNRYETTVDYTINHLKNLRIQLGGSLRYEILNAPSLTLTESETRLSKSLYSSIEWRPTGSLLFNVGLMLQDSNNTTITINPRLAFNYRFMPKHSLRGSVSYSERPPGLLNQNEFTTLQFDNGTVLGILVFADEQIDNERLISYELGYNGNLIANKLDLDLRVYRQEARDGIDDFSNATPFGIIPATQFFDNTSDWNTTGFETELKYHFDQGAFIHLNYGYANIDGERLRGLSPRVFESVDNAIAKHSLGVLISKKFNHDFHLSTAYYYQSDMRWLGQRGPVEVNRLDLMARKSFQLGGSKVDLSLILQGLLGEYDELQVGNTFEPRAYLQLGFEL